jgi:hypothetical protein
MTDKEQYEILKMRNVSGLLQTKRRRKTYQKDRRDMDDFRAILPQKWIG